MNKNKQAALAKLRNDPLLEKCENGCCPLPVGTLVWAKDVGSIFWPACIAEHPAPAEDEPQDELNQESPKFAFLVFLEPRFRQGLVSWDRVIVAHTADVAKQKMLVMELNRLESKKQLKISHTFHDSCSLMETFVNVASTERHGLILQKFQEFSKERRAKDQGKLKGIEAPAEAELEPKSAVSQEKESPKPIRPRASSNFSLRPNVTVPKPWEYSAPKSINPSTTAPRETSSTISSISSTKSKPKSLDMESLKILTEKTFGEMDKQMKFDSKEYFSCSKCMAELKDKNEYSLCHDFPFHKSCLIQTNTKNAAGESVVTFKCVDCVEQRCFVCKKADGAEQELPTKCSKCDLRFHRDCLVFNWPQADVMGSSGAITCPLHCCHVCKAEHYHFDKVRTYRLPASKAIRCLLCPTAYHKGTCIPAGSGNTIMRNQFLICPRHTYTKTTTESSVPKTRKLGCFICETKILQKDDVVNCTLCPLAFHTACVYGEFHIKAGISLEDLRKSFKCEGCLWGRFPLYGEVAWYQQPGSVYWPARILYPKEAAIRGAVAPGEFSVGYCGYPVQFYDRGRRNYMVPLEIGSLGFLKRLKLISNEKVNAAATQAFHLIKLSENHRDQNLSAPEPDFKKIDKNIYRIPPSSITLAKSKPSGKRGSGKLKSSGEEKSTCRCGEAGGTAPVCTPDSGCFNRSTATECDETNCSGKERCDNRMFSKPSRSGTEDLKMEYFVSPCKKGFGLKSKCSITEGTFLSQYVGEVISKNEYMWRTERKSLEDPVYFLQIDPSTYIDAEYYGNLARLMNHACDPNCRIQKYKTANSKPVVGIFANRDIEPGEELTFDYNFSNKSTFSFHCRCMSAKCKGVIGRLREDEENLMPNGKKLSGKKAVKDEGWRWEDECATCGARGELLMCEFPDCPKTHHAACVGLEGTPKGEWICPKHVDETKMEIQAPRPKKRKLQTRVQVQ